MAAELGIRFKYFNDARPDRFFLPEVMSGGAGWLDFDNDGRLDLLLTNGCRLPDREKTDPATICRLFRNAAPGPFDDVSAASFAGGQGYWQGIAVADYNVDGFAEPFLTSYGPERLLENNGDGTFQDVTPIAGTTDPDWSTSAAWFDFDGDGDDDLYVVNYLNVTFENHKICRYHGVAGYCGPGSFEAVPDRLYRNEGDGRFTECAAAAGLVGEQGKGMGVAILDLDHDLVPEVYVANDMCANFLFVRQPGITEGPAYRNVAVESGCALSGTGQAEASMGIGCADFDGDGQPDLVLTHYLMQKNTLYRNLGSLHFHDDSLPSRIAACSKMSLGFGIAPLDFDRDMAPDLFIANGHVLGKNVTPNEMTPQVLHNDGRGRFHDISALAGDFFSELMLARGVAAADFDDDGDSDFLVAMLNRPAALLRNDTSTGRHWLGIHLATQSRTLPVGGRVVVTAAGKEQVHPLMSGGSYLASGDQRLLFGLGDAKQVDRVQIFWPSGQVEEFTSLEVDRYWSISEGREPRHIARGAGI